MLHRWLLSTIVIAVMILFQIYYKYYYNTVTVWNIIYRACAWLTRATSTCIGATRIYTLVHDDNALYCHKNLVIGERCIVQLMCRGYEGRSQKFVCAG